MRSALCLLCGNPAVDQEDAQHSQQHQEGGQQHQILLVDHRAAQDGNRALAGQQDEVLAGGDAEQRREVGAGGVEANVGG